MKSIVKLGQANKKQNVAALKLDRSFWPSCTTAPSRPTTILDLVVTVGHSGKRFARVCRRLGAIDSEVLGTYPSVKNIQFYNPIPTTTTTTGMKNDRHFTFGRGAGGRGVCCRLVSECIMCGLCRRWWWCRMLQRKARKT